MKKQILNLGKSLSKAEQKLINGSGRKNCPCPFGERCAGNYCVPLK